MVNPRLNHSPVSTFFFMVLPPSFFLFFPPWKPCLPISWKVVRSQGYPHKIGFESCPCCLFPLWKPGLTSHRASFMDDVLGFSLGDELGLSVISRTRFSPAADLLRFSTQKCLPLFFSSSPPNVLGFRKLPCRPPLPHHILLLIHSVISFEFDILSTLST